MLPLLLNMFIYVFFYKQNTLINKNLEYTTIFDFSLYKIFYNFYTKRVI